MQQSITTTTQQSENNSVQFIEENEVFKCRSELLRSNWNDPVFPRKSYYAAQEIIKILQSNSNVTFAEIFTKAAQERQNMCSSQKQIMEGIGEFRTTSMCTPISPISPIYMINGIYPQALRYEDLWQHLYDLFFLNEVQFDSQTGEASLTIYYKKYRLTTIMASHSELCESGLPVLNISHASHDAYSDLLPHIEKLFTKLKYIGARQRNEAKTLYLIGKIHWLLAHTMPLTRGSAATTHIVSEALCYATLSKFLTCKEGVVLDLEALFCEDIEKFAVNYHNLFEENSFAALSSAQTRSSEEIIAELLKQHQIGDKPLPRSTMNSPYAQLIWYTTNRNIAKIKEVISQMREINEHTYYVTDKRVNLSQALAYFIVKGDIEAVKILLDNGIIKDINAPEIYSRDHEILWTPLHFACAAGNLEIAKLLISKGAKTDIKSVHCCEAYNKQGYYKGITSIKLAENNGHHELVALLQSENQKSCLVEILINQALNLIYGAIKPMPLQQFNIRTCTEVACRSSFFARKSPYQTAFLLLQQAKSIDEKTFTAIMNSFPEKMASKNTTEQYSMACSVLYDMYLSSTKLSSATTTTTTSPAT